MSQYPKLATSPLYLWRLQRHWSRPRLARELGVTRQAIWSWETGQNLPRIDLFMEIQHTTGITMQQWSQWYHGKHLQTIPKA